MSMWGRLLFIVSLFVESKGHRGKRKENIPVVGLRALVSQALIMVELSRRAHCNLWSRMCD